MALLNANIGKSQFQIWTVLEYYCNIDMQSPTFRLPDNFCPWRHILYKITNKLTASAIYSIFYWIEFKLISLLYTHSSALFYNKRNNHRTECNIDALALKGTNTYTQNMYIRKMKERESIKNGGITKWVKCRRNGDARLNLTGQKWLKY